MTFSSIKRGVYRFLKWSEKYTRTDMIYLARGSFWMSAKRVVYVATAFVVAITFANFFPQEAYGEYKYLLSMAGLLAIVTMRGLNTSYLRTVSRGYEGMFWPVLRSRLKWGLLASVASAAVALYYFYQGDITMATGFFLSALFVPPLNAFTVFIPLLNGRKHFQLSAQYETIVQIVAATSIIVTVLATDTVGWVLLSYFVSYTLMRIIVTHIVTQRHAPNNNTEDDTISYGRHLTAMVAIGDVASRIDSILTWHFLGAVPLAIYSFANMPTKHLRSLVSSTGLLALIKLSEKDKDKIKKTLPRKIGIFFLGIVPIVIAYILAAPLLFQIAFPQYIEAVPYTQVLSLSLLFYPKILFGSALTAHAEKKSLYIMNITTPLVNITLLLILLPLYGIWGLVGATLGTQVFKTGLLTWLFIRM